MAEENKEKPQGKKGLPFIAKVLIIAIVLILIVVISVGSAFFIASKMNKSSGDGSNTVENSKVEATAKEGEKTSYGKTVEFGEYTVNLKTAPGEDPKYMVVKINFELAPDIDEKKLATVTTDIEEKKIILQDVMLTILRDKTQVDLEADVNYEKLKKELAEACNKVLGEELVKTIRFNNLLVQ